MPRYYFKISHGKYAGAPETALDFVDDNAARMEMTKVFGDLVADVARCCAPDTRWQMETQNEARKPLFRIRLVTENLVQSGSDAYTLAPAT